MLMRYFKPHRTFTLVTTALAAFGCSDPLSPSFAAAGTACNYETIGTSQPASSGTPLVVDETTGTVISANFFNSGAINPQDGDEFVSVCIFPPDENGNIKGRILSDVGVDDDTIIKAYPEILIGTKFGNIYETSYRYYPNADLPPEQQWPVTANGIASNGSPYEFANLEYVSVIKDVGLPAFTNNLPDIQITLNMDESNIVSAERDVMLESWFHDTSTNASLIGLNAITGIPVANTLNNIVGIGHPHYNELNNTILEMMVHIGPLSKNDISSSNRNPGQNQLTEIYSGKDSDGDGIDDHFDVDSHLNVNNNLDPSPGKYSSGIDNNNDGIDDADILPVTIGNYQYSIWYGASYLAPIVIYSRETNDTLTNDFDPLVADMNLTAEGDINLHWNEFLDFTLDENQLQNLLQQDGVSWASGNSSPFPAMRSSAGAISGLELGVEPQTNNDQDASYSVNINTYDVRINGRALGLTDGIPPAAETLNPADNSSLEPVTLDINGTVYDSASGTDEVKVRVQRLGVSPAKYWNGTDWTSTSSFPTATIIAPGTVWTLENVDLNQPGDYRIRVIAIDNAGNISSAIDNPNTDFSINNSDTTSAVATATTPADGSTINPGTTNVEGTVVEMESGIESVKVRIQRLGISPAEYWNGTAWTTASAYPEASINSTGTNWTLPSVDLNSPGNYRVRILTSDIAGNTAGPLENPKTSFTVANPDSSNPISTATTPADGSVATPGITDIQGTVIETQSGINSVKVRVQRLGVSPALYWNGTAWTTVSTYPEASINSAGTNWTLTNVDLNASGNYRVRIIATDIAGNTSGPLDNPKTGFSVASADITDPVATATSPADGSAITPGTIDIQGTVVENESGIKNVKVRVQRLGVSPAQYWNGTAWTINSAYPAAAINSSGTNWTLPGVDLNSTGGYRIRIIATDLAGNTSGPLDNPKTGFSVN